MNSYSTDSCLTQLTDQIRFDMDKGNYTGMVMIDLQKAFDTVDHDILLNKLKAIGLDDLSTSWLSSYLKNRFQIFLIPWWFPAEYRRDPSWDHYYS